MFAVKRKKKTIEPKSWRYKKIDIKKYLVEFMKYVVEIKKIKKFIPVKITCMCFFMLV